MLGLDDYGHQCAWRTLAVTGSLLEFKQPSLYSYRDGPKSWQTLVDDPARYYPDYFNCRSDTVTSRDKSDLREIYSPDAFTANDIYVRANSQWDHWYFRVGSPPSDTAR